MAGNAARKFDGGKLLFNKSDDGNKLCTEAQATASASVPNKKVDSRPENPVPGQKVDSSSNFGSGDGPGDGLGNSYDDDSSVKPISGLKVDSYADSSPADDYGPNHDANNKISSKFSAKSSSRPES